jgi:hypothetical protein
VTSGREREMKKAILGLAFVGVVVGLRPVARRTRAKMRGRCGEMAAHCKEMMAAKNGSSEVPGEREAEERSKKQRVVVATA